MRPAATGSVGRGCRLLIQGGRRRPRRRDGSQNRSLPRRPQPSPPAPRVVGTRHRSLDQLVTQGPSPWSGERGRAGHESDRVDAMGGAMSTCWPGRRASACCASFAPSTRIDGPGRRQWRRACRDAATGLPVWALYGSGRAAADTPPCTAGGRRSSYSISRTWARAANHLSHHFGLTFSRRRPAQHAGRWCWTGRRPHHAGKYVEGPLMDAGTFRSFTSPHAIPVRTGMTALYRRFARMVVAERKLAGCP